MPLGPRKRAAALLAAVVTAFAVWAVVAFGTTAGILVIVSLQIVTLLVCAFAAVEVDRRRRSGDDATRTRVLRDVRRALKEAMGELSEVVQENATAAIDAVQAADVRSREHALVVESRLTDEIRVTRQSSMESVSSRFQEHERRVTRRLLTDFAQTEALLALYHEVRPERALPPTRSWAASPDLLRTCWTSALEQRPELILECGSGVSTIIFAYACRRMGVGRVVALEHEEAFAEETRASLRRHGLSDWADVRWAPLEPLPASLDSARWYALDAVPEGPIDLLFVDGPPANQDPTARQPALPVLYDRLSDDAVIILDDQIRAVEGAHTAGLPERYPDLALEVLEHEKGTAVLRRRP